MQNNCSNEVTYGGFFARLAAYVIDSVIIACLTLIVRLPVSALMAAFPDSFIAGNMLFDYTLKDILIYLCGVAYAVLLIYQSGTTIGKRAMNLRVVSKEGGRLTFMNVLFRETIGKFLSGVILCIGYIMIGLDKEKKALHDTLSDTYVVYERKVRVTPVYPVGYNPVPQVVTPPPAEQWATGSSPVPPMPPVNPPQAELQAEPQAEQPEFRQPQQPTNINPFMQPYQQVSEPQEEQDIETETMQEIIQEGIPETIPEEMESDIREEAEQDE